MFKLLKAVKRKHGRVLNTFNAFRIGIEILCRKLGIYMP